MTSARITGLYFGPSTTLQGQRVEADFRSRTLVVVAGAREIEVPYSRLVPRSGGWNHGALLLEWSADDGVHSLSLQRDALATLQRTAPDELRARLGAALQARRSGIPRGLLVASGIVAAVAALVLVLFFTAFDRVVDAAVRRVPTEWEEKLGAMTAETLTAATPRWPDGPARRMLEDLGGRLAASAAAPYTFHWILVDSPQVNALAAPGGYVVVFTGLLRAARTPEEVAGVLAHEVQHVLLRHSLRGVVRNLGWRATLSLLLSGTGEWGAPLAAWAEQLGSLRFSRDQENEADARGVELLQRAGIDPAGMAAFFERLAAESGQPPEFLSTHPASADRAQRVRELAGPTQAPPLGYDWAAIQAELQPEPAPATPR